MFMKHKLKSKITTSHYVSLWLYCWKALVTFSHFGCLCPIYLSTRYFSDGAFISLLLREGLCTSFTLSGFYPSHIPQPSIKQGSSLAARVPPAGFVITNNIPTSVLQITAAKSIPLVAICFHLSCTLTALNSLTSAIILFFKWLNCSRLMGIVRAEPGCFCFRFSPGSLE